MACSLILFSVNLFVGLMNVSGGIMRHDVSDILWGSVNLLIAFLLWLSDRMDARKAVRDDAGDRINRNALELAEWFAGMSFTDPDDQLAQSQLRGVLENGGRQRGRGLEAADGDHGSGVPYHGVVR